MKKESEENAVPRHPKHAHAGEPDTDALIERVQKLSKARGERMTDVRRDVVKALARLKTPHRAYRILAELNKKRTPKLSAMSLYRTLDFLIDLGVVVKLDSQNSFQLCDEHGHDHSHLLMICDVCGAMQEIHDSAASKKMHQLALAHGHVLKHHVVEFHGACVQCAT